MRRRSRVRLLVTPRRTIALLAVVVGAWICYRHVVPELAAVHARRALAANGYPDADLQIERVGIDHTQISGVVLGPGLVLGDIGIDVGVSYLWGDRAHEVTIRHARISAAAVAELATRTGRATTKPRRAPRLPAERIRIDDAQITVGTTQVAVTGQTAPAADGTIELSFEARARERGRPVWTAKGHGSITVAPGDLAIREVRGHADLVVPAGELGSIAFTDARVSLDVTGKLHEGKLDAWKLRVDAGHARFAGGELSVEPFDIVANRPIDFVVRGRGLQLEKLPGRNTIQASGLVDGHLGIRIEGTKISPLDGELQARAGGRIRLTDPAWRRRLAGAAGKGHAIRERLAGALADLDYSKLTLALAPPGADPELRIALSGRGHDHPQELDLAVNLRGIRDIFHRLTKPTTPRSPP